MGSAHRRLLCMEAAAVMTGIDMSEVASILGCTEEITAGYGPGGRSVELCLLCQGYTIPLVITPKEARTLAAELTEAAKHVGALRGES